MTATLQAPDQAPPVTRAGQHGRVDRVGAGQRRRPVRRQRGVDVRDAGHDVAGPGQREVVIVLADQPVVVRGALGWSSVTQTTPQLSATLPGQPVSSRSARPRACTTEVAVVAAVRSTTTLTAGASQPSPRSALVPIRHCVPPLAKNAVISGTYLMHGWLQAVSKVNPLSYEVDALRGLLIGTPAHLLLDAAVLVSATIAGVTAAALLLPRLAR
jgi:hypothetical protein